MVRRAEPPSPLRTAPHAPRVAPRAPHLGRAPPGRSHCKRATRETSRRPCDHDRADDRDAHRRPSEVHGQHPAAPAYPRSAASVVLTDLVSALDDEEKASAAHLARWPFPHCLGGAAVPVSARKGGIRMACRGVSRAERSGSRNAAVRRAVASRRRASEVVTAVESWLSRLLSSSWLGARAGRGRARMRRQLLGLGRVDRASSGCGPRAFHGPLS